MAAPKFAMSIIEFLQRNQTTLRFHIREMMRELGEEFTDDVWRLIDAYVDTASKT